MLELQAVDTEIDQLQHRRRNLPEQAALKQLAGEHAVVAEELVAAETRASDLEMAVAKAESDLVPVRERRVRDQERIADGSVPDPKTLATMVDEVDHLARRISDLEDIQLEVMEEHETAARVRDQLAARKSGIGTEATGVKQRRDAAIAEIDAGLASRTTVRDDLANGLPAPLVQTYQKSRTGLGGVGAVALVGRRCTGCQIEINQADLRAYAVAAEDELLRCEECGRILVRTAESAL